MALQPFGEWRPDITDLDTGDSINIMNVVPRADGYGPFQDFVPFTTALPDLCRGGFYARNADGSITVFAATSTRLFKLDNTTFAWIDISKGGVAYSAVDAPLNWQFAQFNNFVFAVQSNTVPQVFDLTISTSFADLAGTPPNASYIAIIGRFVVLGGLLASAYRVQWSDLDNTTEWTPGVGQSDFQDLPDGGIVRGIAGGDQFGIIFQDQSIRSMIFAPGSAVVFEILRISYQDGLFTQGSIINAGNVVFFCSPQGFKTIAMGGYPTPIGNQRVDKTFFADVDQDNLQFMIGAADPTKTRVYWAYKSLAGQAGQFDKVLSYDWALDKWTMLLVSGQFLLSLAKPGLTLEALDAISPGIITISGAANNGSGLIRLTLSGLKSGLTDLTAENSVVVYDVTGTTEANGTFAFRIIDSTHIDLVGSAFVNAYTGGGQIGGALDGLLTSLDNFSVAAAAQLAAIGPAGQLGLFTGSTLAAIMETPEFDGQGQRIFVSAVRPMTDAPTVMCSIAARDNAQAISVNTVATRVNQQGLCPQRIETRYARATVTIPAGSTWTYALGVEPTYNPSGSR
jgi:hypothetical protein